MKGPLIEFAGCDADNDSECARDEVRRAREDEGNSAAEAEAADDGREEIVETAGAEMLCGVNDIGLEANCGDEDDLPYSA